MPFHPRLTERTTAAAPFLFHRAQRRRQWRTRVSAPRPTAPSDAAGDLTRSDRRRLQEERRSACGSCAMWRQHYNRGHTGHDKKQFFAVASGDFRHSMRIPWEVGNHLGSMISGTIKLEAPNGIFSIGVCRKTGELVLRSGWDKFVAVHHIEENCSLWFVYRGNSTFKVHIFNSNGDVKVTSCSQPPSQSFGGVPPGATCDHHVLNEQVLSDPGHVQTSTDSGYSILPGCHLTKAQDEKVREIACTMRSEVPLYVAVMNESNVNFKDCSVNLPLKLVEHFKEDTSKATIQLEAPNDIIYGVEACKHGADQIVLQYGWNNLVDANRIQENDLLIFITKGKKRLEVRILGTSVHQRTSSCFDTGNISSTQEICEHSLEITDPPPHRDYYVSSSDDDHIVEEGIRKSCGRQKQAPSRCAKTQKVASTSSPSAKSGFSGHEAHTLNERASVEFGVDLEPHSSSNLEGPSQHPYILAEAGINLGAVEKKKVEEKVQAIQSELPIFVAVMTTTWANSSDLRFCQEYGSRCIPPIKKKRALVLQAEGSMKEQAATLVIDANRSKWIRSGWKKFVADNDVQVGDIVLFEQAKSTKELRMTVYFVRKSEKATSCSQPPSQSFGGVPPAATCDHHVLNEQVNPPPHTDYYVSSSDDDDIVEEGTRKSCYYVSSSDDDDIVEEGTRKSCYYVSVSDDEHIVEEGTRKSCRRQKQAPSRCAKAQKVASTSSPSAAKSGYEARKLNEQASVEFGVDLEPHSSSNLEGPSQHPYILSEGRTSLSSVAKKKIEEKVQAIQSELPIFVAVMTKSRINSNQLRMCKEYGSRYIPHINRRMRLVLQSEGSTPEQPARLVIDKNGVRWIRIGWQKFIADNDVQEGDIVLFERAKSTKELRMTVYFVRKSSQT